jgi:type II restriction enzyme
VLLALPAVGLEGYKSRSQRARIATEAWATSYLFCPNCDSPRLRPSAANTPAVDFDCARCNAFFQLKSQSRPFSGRIVDAAYEAMRRAILEARTPNLLALHYDANEWVIRNLILIPHFAFVLSVLEKRKPLRLSARRAGWIGCNILLGRIPPDARISIVADGSPASPAHVRREYRRLKPLEKLGAEKRGWTLDVLSAVRSLQKPDFTLSEVYSLERHLAALHPKNRHVRDKIRQQLQVLRDLRLIEFLGGGNYRLR